VKVELVAFLGVLIINLIPFVGVGFLFLNIKHIDKISKYLVSFAVGALLGNAFIHIIPEVFSESIHSPLVSSVSIVGGIILFYVLEQYLRWQHIHGEPDLHTHKHHIAAINIIGDTVHNLLDGILIASSFAVDYRLGIGTILAVILHEIPQELGDLGVLLYAKWPIKKILLVNILSGTAAFIGLAIGFIFSSGFEGFANIAVAVTAGGFIYLACTDLLPDLHENGAESGKQRALQLIILLLGIGAFVLL
jgi:zinc and cadmium transporter